MKLDVTREELILLLTGLYAAADTALTQEEADEYDKLSDRIASVLRD